MAGKCMEQYISQQKISEADKEKMKQNHKQWLRRLFRALSNDFVSVENILKKNTLENFSLHIICYICIDYG